MICIRPVSYKVQINHELTDTIVPNKSITQGDLISPYIFTIPIEWLSTSLDAQIQGVKINQNAPSILLLFSADDNLVFTKASIEHATKIKDILLRYEKISRQVVHY